MLLAPIPADEEERLGALHQLNLLSTPAEEVLDCITRTGARLVGVPVALISLIDKNRQWFKSKVGLDAAETPRDVSFCGHAILQDDLFVIPDAKADPRFSDNPLVTGPPYVASYAGIALHSREGFALGTLCFIDHVPHFFDAETLAAIRDLAKVTERVLEGRELSQSVESLLSELEAARRDALLDPLTEAWNRRGLQELYDREARRLARSDDYLSLAIVDIDHFKQVNDRYGHACGDKVIHRLAQILRSCSRAYDIVARVGGEEFVVLMAGVTPDQAPFIGEKLVNAVRTNGGQPPMTYGSDVMSISISAGLVSLPGRDAPAALERVMERADLALYQAKHQGRNRVIIGQWQAN